VNLNNGTGWDATPDARWTFATSTLYKSPDVATNTYYDRGMRFTDINGDGLPDFIRYYYVPVATSNSAPSIQTGGYAFGFRNTGTGWATSSTAILGSTYATQGSLSGTTWTGNLCLHDYVNWTGNGQNAQDVLSTITYPQGGSTSVTYEKTAQDGNNT